MVLIKSSSTGKATVKQIQLTRRTDCATLLKLSPNMYKQDSERPQPIKIAQLLGLSENSKSTHKNSERKKIQPERLGTLSSKKNPERLRKQYGTNNHIKSVYSDKHVRRNLNFNEICSSSSKKNNENKTQSNKLISNKDKPIHENGRKSMRKKSLLLPPNTIKNKHLKKGSNCPKISDVSREVDESGTESAVKKENEIIKMDNILLLHNQSIGVSVIPTVSPDSIKTAKSLVSSQCTTPQQVTINEDQLLTQNNSMQRKFIPKEPNLKSKICAMSREENDCIQNLCNNLQDTQLMAVENDMNTEHGLSEMIYLNKDTIIRLKHDLKDLLEQTEKNVLRIRSTLTCVTRLLSINDKKTTLSNVDIKEDHSTLKKENDTMVDKEVQVETCRKSIHCAEEKLKMPITEIIVTDTEIIDKSKLTQDTENDKENIKYENTRISDVSFMELENQLNITHAKPAEEYSIQLKTPIIPKYKQKRPLREYMALKSSVSFLETPDGKKFRSLCQINDINKSDLNATYISNKLLTDLNNLYSDSPESSL